jgi:hypothetical protein
VPIDTDGDGADAATAPPFRGGIALGGNAIANADAIKPNAPT